jgi:Tol biopolymer transport system component
MSLQVGQRVGSYEITALLGKGGMGEVYRARDTRLGRDVAIKILARQFTDHSDQLTRFEREARVLASLNHPNIGAIYGVEESKGGRALVLELVEGDTLAQKISGRISIDQILSIARQIADALDVAHEKGIVHRDLKPANIKITPGGVVKVLDFGLAKLAMPSGSASPGVNADTIETLTALGATEHGVILGTVAYMSPEQARGQTVDKRTDIWAFGCVLYEMLVGRAAFAGETTTDILAAIVGSGPDWSALPSSTPAVIQRLLRRCLTKHPKERLRDIGDARTEIDEARTGATTIPPTAPTSRLPWLIASVAAVVAVAALAAAWLIQPKPNNVAPRFTRIIPLTSGPARDLGPAISPDGKWVAYISNVGGQNDIWVRFVAGGEANLTAATNLSISATTGIGGLDISPDGTRIAVMAKPRSSNGSFATWEIPAPLPGEPRQLLDEGLLGMRWSQDGRAIAFIRAGAAAGDALWVADADGTNRREILPARDGIHIHWPTWSKDGLVYFIRTITTVANLDQAEIYRINPRGGAAEPVVSTLRRAMHPVLIPNGDGLIYAANPTGVDLGLWWLPATVKDPIRLTMGIGDYSEPRVSADGRTLVATRYEVRQSLMRVATTEAEFGRVAAVTNGYGGDLDPSVSPSGDRIVFSSSRTGERHLWTARIDGSEMRQLTSGTGLDDRPTFSPDGKQIVFNSDRGGRRSIWVIKADGGTPRKVADAPTIGGLSWSRDGSKVVYAAGTGGWPTLWSLSVDTGQVQPIAAPGAVSEPAWNPGRDLIAYMQALTTGDAAFTRLSFVNSKGEPQYTTLPPSPDISAGFSNGTTAWSPDGQRLAVVAQNTNTVASIWIVTPDSKDPFRKLVELPVGPRIRGISWTPDGKALIFGQHDSIGDIVLMDGGN